ncbi:phospho-sugar mutase [Pseudobacteriovorax antillogorgiicola]|uniref:Alpha-phosphoglucomutase n=1 Tax=Pseudobacteriovorax antillogorgiicola TaxID=1513793 RepID=A0A1Y6CIL3_9BACT|nr:phospho-sugar mutase [Pseudobacteriovorax antillogorgiicola]TCS46678.1 alpha-phosphoglucomutase [Pseudobacteriovorax antillogorgiicola]SMF66681.1 alpha-phosphoglucomutase [Pseudobacteriovorax antillogorgiicola]
MEGELKAQANYWATSAVFDVDTRREIQGLLDEGNSQELKERFYKDLEFGTGGMRGILGAGTSRMNIYNVRKATQAFADHINEFFPERSDKSIAISYDSRRFSRDFAEATAEVMAANGIKAYITKELRPTPMLSFMVRYFKCVGGVCVTASHNPPNYNGYKVYWETGGQIVPPHDQAVIDRYSKLKAYEDIKVMSFSKGLEKGLIEEVGRELDDSYFERVAELRGFTDGAPIKIVYTPLHGTGAFPVEKALNMFGFQDVISVPEQRDPNGDFPTVKFPNPEDPEALKMAIDLGRSLDADLIMGTDPDTDRIGIVVKEGDDYTILNGNQIGCLLVDYVLSSQKALGKLPDNPLVIKTIVTTDLQEKIATHYGASCEETLTGFKWICQLVEDIEAGRVKPYRKYVCGGEESFGFLAGSFVRDKDAVSACCIAAEMISHYKAKGLTCSDVLDQMYRRHGVYMESLKTVTLPGMEGAAKISAMMDRLRSTPPREITGISVLKMRDLQTSQEYEQIDGKFQPTDQVPLPSSNVLQFTLEDGSKISARPSGTEPKIKFYFSVPKDIDADADDQTLNAAKDDCTNRLQLLESTFASMTQ